MSTKKATSVKIPKGNLTDAPGCDPGANPVVVKLPIKPGDIQKVMEGSSHFEDNYLMYNPDISVPNAYNECNDHLQSNPEELACVDGVETDGMMGTAQHSAPPTNVCCHWCCHPFDTPAVGVPYVMSGDTYHTLGTFCSFECAAAHNFDSCRGDTMWERHSLLNHMAHQMGITHNIRCAMSKMVLKMFGGTMSIDVFRANHTSIVFEMHPPMVSHKPEMKEVTNYVKDISTFVPLDIERVHRLEQKLKDNTHAAFASGNNIITQMNVKVM